MGCNMQQLKIFGNENLEKKKLDKFSGPKTNLDTIQSFED